MQYLKEELDGYKSYREMMLVNDPGWTDGTFLFYTKNQDDSRSCLEKDKFVKFSIRGKTGAAIISMKIESVIETPFIFSKKVKGNQIPILEMVNGTIVALQYVTGEIDNLEYDSFCDSNELIGRICSAYCVDVNAMQKQEGLLNENTEAHAFWDQFEKNMDKLKELGYCGDFIILP